MELYKGFPLTAKDTLEEMIEKGYLELVEPVEGDLYALEEPGVYSCYINEAGAYHELRIFVVSESDCKFHLKDKFTPKQMATTEDGAEDGWQPTGKPKLSKPDFRRDQRDMMLCIWPKEILMHFGAAEEPEHHQTLTQQGLMKALADMEQKCPYMTLHTLGKTKNLDMDIPAVYFSLPDEGLQNSKVKVLYQAQVHGNEPASCDGALEVMRRIIEEDSYRELLHHMDLLVVPRVNPEGAYLYRRMNYDDIDLNRDHMTEDGWETQIMHQLFQQYQPEVILDGHEFISYEVEETEAGPVTKRGWDLMTSPGTSLNIDPKIRELGLNLCGTVMKQLIDQGVITDHFGSTANPAIGRTYYGLHQRLAFLIETRGIGAGRHGYERRVKGQVAAVTAYLKEVAKHATEIKALCHKVSQECHEGKIVVLQQEATGETLTTYRGMDLRYTMDGSFVWEKEDYMPLQDTVLRSRPMAKGYVLSSRLEQIDKILQMMDRQGIRYEELKPGTKIKVQQYISLGKREEDGANQDIVADLLPEKEVTFEEAVYFFPANQPGGMILAMLMEPDVTDGVSARGTLFQQKRLQCEDNYRVI